MKATRSFETSVGFQRDYIIVTFLKDNRQQQTLLDVHGINAEQMNFLLRLNLTFSKFLHKWQLTIFKRTGF
jgi:hypothetical protein